MLVLFTHALIHLKVDGRRLLNVNQGTCREENVLNALQRTRKSGSGSSVLVRYIFVPSIALSTRTFEEIMLSVTKKYWKVDVHQISLN